MERGSTRVEKALQSDNGIEWHVYRMGLITDYYIGTARCVNGKWRAIADVRSPVDEGRFVSRRAAILALCKLDDIRQ